MKGRYQVTVTVFLLSLLLILSVMGCEKKENKENQDKEPDYKNNTELQEELAKKYDDRI